MNKIITLDLNHWIEIAKQNKKGNTFLFDHLAKLVEKDNVIFPLSAMTFMEISAISKIQQRLELSNIIHTISKGWIIKPFFDIMYIEIIECVANHFKDSIQAEYIKENAVVNGYNYILPKKNLPLDFQKIGIESCSKEFLDMLFTPHNPKMKNDSFQHNLIKQAGENDRLGNKNKNIEEMERECVLGFNMKFIDLYLKSVEYLKIPNKEVINNAPKHFFTPDYLATIPTINVYAKLMMHVYYNKAIKSEANDDYDIAHISASLPYSDVILVDKKMEHFIKKSKLHKEYNTKVIKNILDLMDL